MLDKLLGKTFLIEKSLDATWLRNEAISQNIANVDTPGYKRKEVDFEELLDKSIKNSKEKVDKIDIEVKEDYATSSVRIDGNNVDIEREMALMVKNNLKYNLLVQRISGKFNTMKSVIRGGR